MHSHELRQTFLDFFASQGHTIVESASLVPDNDPTLLFTNAGMVQFKEALAFREDRGYTRAVSCQRCVRAGGKHNDLDNVGYTARHHTFFEMLGNFSFGDYFKRDAIKFAWEFLTEVLKLPPERLWITIHTEDDEAEVIWADEVGLAKHRISRLGDDDNFWTMGNTGPCGPSSEIFYDHGPQIPGGPPGSPEGDLDRYIEIWNLVFTQYDRAADGTLTPLPKPCVDTGMGLERLAAVLQQVHDNYAIDLFQALICRASELLSHDDLAHVSLKVVADHIRSTAFLIADGVLPSNEGRGYVLRRIIRRALRHGHKLQAVDPFFHKMVQTLVSQMGDAYPILVQTQAQLEKIILKEEQQFKLTLDQGMKILNESIANLNGTTIPGATLFKLYDTYGFPVDLTADIARERNLNIDIPGFEQEMAAQKRRARAASTFTTVATETFNLKTPTAFVGYDTLQSECRIVALFRGDATVNQVESGEDVICILDHTPFYAESGGQVGDTGRLHTKGVSVIVTDTISRGAAVLHKVRLKGGILRVGDMVHAVVDKPLRDATRLNHSATHLLHAALREVLGDHIKQRGSLVNAEKLRFDFSHFEAMTKQQLQTIEHLVNHHIRFNTVIQTEVMALDEAKCRGAMALFGEKYSHEVRVLTMGNGFSIELCGGTHASRTGDIGLFRVLSETGIAAGVRRIEAITGHYAIQHLARLDKIVTEMVALLRTDPANLTGKLSNLLEQNKKLEKTVSQLNMQLARSGDQDLADAAIEVQGIKAVIQHLETYDPKQLSEIMQSIKNKLQSGIVVLATVNEGKISLIAGVTKDLTKKVNAGQLINHLALQVDGKGGGRPDMARAGGKNLSALPAALASVPAYLNEQLS